ncbi:unnamed protein product [Arctogadus glacialis]
MGNVRNAAIIPMHSQATRATDRVSYLQWATVDKEHKIDPGAASKITLKREFECSQDELVETFTILLQKFRRHLFNIRQQYAFSRALKLNYGSIYVAKFKWQCNLQFAIQ